MFSFKRFDVVQGGAAMKVGTDGVLLGAWCPMGHRPGRILDVGTGTGLIALMVAQRGEPWGCRVDAVDIDEGACRQAAANFAASPWTDKLTVYHSDIQGFTDIETRPDAMPADTLGVYARSAGNFASFSENKPSGQPQECAPLSGDEAGSGGRREIYDLVVSNPPFFSDSLVPPDARRAVARHTSTLGFDDLARCAAAVCSAHGTFAVILPAEQAGASILAAAAHGFHLHSRLDVRPTPQRPPRRTLLAFGRKTVEPAYGTLTIETARHDYTPEYRELTRDFYLKF